MNSRCIDYKEFNAALDRLMRGQESGFSEKAVTTAAEVVENNSCDGGKGRLIVQVSTASEALPISDAKVIISDSNGNVISEQLTDNSGRIKSVELCTPIAANSQSPGNLVTYSTYNVRVEKDGYFTEEFLNVAVFDKIESIQPVSLEPLGENALENDRVVINEEMQMENVGESMSNGNEGARVGDVLVIKESPEPVAGADGQQ